MEYTCSRCGNIVTWGAIIGNKFICQPCHECCWKCKFGDKSDCKELDDCITSKSLESCVEETSPILPEPLDLP